MSKKSGISLYGIAVISCFICEIAIISILGSAFILLVYTGISDALKHPHQATQNSSIEQGVRGFY